MRVVTRCDDCDRFDRCGGVLIPVGVMGDGVDVAVDGGVDDGVFGNGFDLCCECMCSLSVNTFCGLVALTEQVLGCDGGNRSTCRVSNASSKPTKLLVRSGGGGGGRGRGTERVRDEEDLAAGVSS